MARPSSNDPKTWLLVAITGLLCVLAYNSATKEPAADVVYILPDNNFGQGSGSGGYPTRAPVQARPTLWPIAQLERQPTLRPIWVHEEREEDPCWLDLDPSDC